MRLQQLSSQDSVEVCEFSEPHLRVGEGTEPHNEDNMVHINEKFIVRVETFADLATTITLISRKIVIISLPGLSCALCVESISGEAKVLLSIF